MNSSSESIAEERWLPIPGYRGHYEASDLGRIRSVDRVITTAKGLRRLPGKILAPAPDGNGYLHVGLPTRDGGPTTRGIHKLVLDAFVGPKPEGLVRRHLNGDQKDNRLVNLKYGTSSENAYDRVRHGNCPNSRKTHCIRGHEYTGENVILRRDRGRECRTCAIERKRQASRKAATSKDNAVFRSLISDLERLAKSGLSYNDQARDLMLSYSITASQWAVSA